MTAARVIILETEDTKREAARLAAIEVVEQVLLPGLMLAALGILIQGAPPWAVPYAKTILELEKYIHKASGRGGVISRDKSLRRKAKAIEHILGKKPKRGYTALDRIKAQKVFVIAMQLIIQFHRNGHGNYEEIIELVYEARRDFEELRAKHEALDRMEDRALEEVYPLLGKLQDLGYFRYEGIYE